jgi:hypothetical protein
MTDGRPSACAWMPAGGDYAPTAVLEGVAARTRRPIPYSRSADRPGGCRRSRSLMRTIASLLIRPPRSSAWTSTPQLRCDEEGLLDRRGVPLVRDGASRRLLLGRIHRCLHGGRHARHGTHHAVSHVRRSQRSSRHRRPRRSCSMSAPMPTASPNTSLPSRTWARVRPDGSRCDRAHRWTAQHRRGAYQGLGTRHRGPLAHARARFPTSPGTSRAATCITGAVDVVVTDGFTGNVVLKLLEGTSRVTPRQVKEAMTSSFIRAPGSRSGRALSQEHEGPTRSRRRTAGPRSSAFGRLHHRSRQFEGDAVAAGIRSRGSGHAGRLTERIADRLSASRIP